MSLLTVEEIKNLPIGDFGDVGVYFLISGEDVVYIGSSYDVGKRLKTHNTSRMDFDRHTFLRIAEGKPSAIEHQYILAMAPKYNKRGNPNHDHATLHSEPLRNVTFGIPLSELARYTKLASKDMRNLSGYLRLCLRAYHAEHPDGLVIHRPK